MNTPWIGLTLLFLGSCSFTPQSGQFSCADDGLCPTGLVCIADRCIDTGAPIDVGPDADSGPADANTPDGGPICMADFCARFDESEDVVDGWTFEVTPSTATVTRELMADAPSPPAVFRSSAGEPVGAGLRSARLSFQRTDALFNEQTPLLRMAFAFKVVDVSEDAGTPAIAGISFGRPERYAVLVVGRGAAELVDVTIYVSAEEPPLSLGTVELGEWNTVTMTIPQRRSEDGAPVRGSVSVDLNGTRLTGALPSVMLTPDLRFDLGVITLLGGTIVVDFDNVEIDYLAR